VVALLLLLLLLPPPLLLQASNTGLSHCLCRPSLVDVPALLLAVTKCTRLCATTNCASCRLKIDCFFSATTNTNCGRPLHAFVQYFSNTRVIFSICF